MALPFNPEPTDALKKRFAEAIKIPYNLATKYAPGETPGSKPENNFHFKDGIRVIISRDFQHGEELLHFSASYEPDIYKGPADDTLLEKMYRHLHELIGDRYDLPIVFAGLSPGAGIPHWNMKFSILN